MAPRRIAALIAALCSSCAALEEEDVFRVRFDVVTQAGEGSFTVRVHPEWAPRGAARFREAVEAGVYDDTRFFRCVPGFVVQFGIPGDPSVASRWRLRTIRDEPLRKPNSRGLVSFASTASPHSRTTQLFINLKLNANLDSMGFAPFGEIEGGGMHVVDHIFPCGDEPDQSRIQSEGNSYLDEDFPDLSQIVSARIVSGDPPPPPPAKEEL